MIVATAALAIGLGQAAAVVEGRVLDDRGVPLAGASVVLAGGAPPGVHPAMTTEDGSFTVAGLAPATYTLTIAKAGYPTIEYGQPRPGSRGTLLELKSGQALTLELRLPRGAAISGQIVDEYGNGAAGQRVIVLRSTPTGWSQLRNRYVTPSPRGDFRLYGLAAGTYRLVALSRDAPNESALSAEGVSVSVSAGDEHEGVTLLALSASKTTSVTLNPVGGTPEQLRYPRTELRRPGAERAQFPYGTRNPDGSITFSGVPAGSYKAIVLAGGLWGAVDIVVDGEHASTIPIPMNRAGRMRGRVVFAGTSPPPRRLSLHLVASDLDGIVTGESNSLAQVGGDGTFTIPTIPGRFLLRIVGGSPDGTWRLASAVHAEIDFADAPLTIDRVEIADVVVTLTDETTVVEGSVQLASGAPANGRVVLLYPADPRQRTRNSRRIDSAVTTLDGKYEIRGLPAGQYAMAVLDELDREALKDPAALAALTPLATLTLTPGKTTTQNVTVKW
ncbi:MAG TPA: carboxypeptidase regulatory-like domain-containing protein [Vicinamibacterales bacterium]|nr:carboxypeptidase regulatory-like domain-containing protein [Vicinamibacterales bacterium]